MKNSIIAVLLFFSLHSVYAQSEEEYEIIDDYSESGAVSHLEPEPER